MVALLVQQVVVPVVELVALVVSYFERVQQVEPVVVAAPEYQTAVVCFF